MEQFFVLSSVLLWIIVLCNLVLTLALVRRINMNQGIAHQEGIEEGQIAPDFTAETLSGEKVTLMTYAHRAVAFVFVAPTCVPCHEALPSYEALRPQAALSGVDLVLVSTADSEQTKHFVNDFNIQLSILVAPRESNLFMQDYKLSTTPSYCLVNRHGKVESTGFTNLKGGKWKILTESWEANKVRNVSIATSER